MLDWWKRRADWPARIAAATDALHAGDADAALAALGTVTARTEAPAEALHLRAVIACRVADFATAQALLEAAVARDAMHFDARATLAEVHAQAERLDVAIDTLRAALACDPSRVASVRRLTEWLARAGRRDAALELWQLLRLLDGVIDPATDPVASLHAQGRLIDAEAMLEALLRRAPDDATLHRLLGVTRQARGRTDSAIDAYRDAVRCAPDDPTAHAKLAFALDTCGDVTAALVHYRIAAERQPDAPQRWSDLLCAQLYLPPPACVQRAADHAEYARRCAASLGPRPAAVPRDPDPSRRLRVAIVSGDFCDHAIAHFLEPWLAHRDRDGIELVAYDRTPQPDATTARLQAQCDVWVDARGADVDALDAQIRADAIDVLIDLKGHFEDSALPLLSRRPAPVQLSWLGYPGSTALATVDGWITDHWIASDLTEDTFAEPVLALDPAFLAFRPRPGGPEPALPAPDAPPTFGCFASFAKVSPQMRTAMVALLTAVPQARLLITAVPNGAPRVALLEQFAQAGVDPDRVTVRGRGDHTAFLRWHHEVHVALDSFPYNGTTTAYHALWMGVPYVALAGRTHVSRVGASILAQVGLDDWIAADVEAWVARAAAAVSGRSPPGGTRTGTHRFAGAGRLVA
jgi:tetratricopeptide (TPR) repeat protein